MNHSDSLYSEKLSAAPYTVMTMDILYELFSHREDWQSVLKFLHERRFSVKDTDATYRAINHWTEQALLDDDREDGSRQWRRLCFLDLLWLRVLRELRAFGLPLDKLIKIYSSLFSTKGDFFWQYELGAALCLKTLPSPVFVIIHNTGEATVETLEEMLHYEWLPISWKPTIRINLNLLCCEILGTEKYLPDIPYSPMLREEESDIINSIRAGKHDAVRVKLHKGRVDLIDKTKKVNDASRIVDLLKEVGFGEVNINVAAGKATSATLSQKRRPKR